ncbi:trypsin-like peptidase domain-containing protein [Neorhizobium galegae]|nr:trypsin-like peptidase domain-containing protein [Neorhizobium galegae]
MEILKVFFGKREDGVWAIQSLKPVAIKPVPGAEPDFYAIENNLFVGDVPFIGTIHSILGQSIVPIVAHVPGETVLRCLGTGFFISCSGLLITAAHVISDPIERAYGGVTEIAEGNWHLGDMKLGVMLPTNPLSGVQGFVFRDILWGSFLGQKAVSPLPIQGLDLKLTSDTAICQVSPLAEGVPHQPLTILQPGIRGVGLGVGKMATAIGYAGMEDIALSAEGGNVVSGDFKFKLHVSRGEITERFPDNAVKREVPTPGPCFSAALKLPGGMSGSPILDDERIYVHGVVSKGWEDEGGPIAFGYGSMLAPSLGLPIRPLDDKALLDLFKINDYGIPKLSIPDA